MLILRVCVNGRILASAAARIRAAAAAAVATLGPAEHLVCMYARTRRSKVPPRRVEIQIPLRECALTRRGRRAAGIA